MVILPEIPRVRLRFYKSYYRCDAKQQNPKICQDLPGICKDSARNLPGTSWSTIASTHLPHIHPPRRANKTPDRKDPKQGGGGDRPLAAFNELKFQRDFIVFSREGTREQY